MFLNSLSGHNATEVVGDFVALTFVFAQEGPTNALNQPKMKIQFLLYSLTVLLTVGVQSRAMGQSSEALLIDKEYNQWEEALKAPEKVYRLNLSNQDITDFQRELPKFINLRYLSLRNDKLNGVPIEIFKLQNLRVLDLGGNTFRELPSEFSQLQNLEELYLDNDKNLDLPKNINVLRKLPRLKILHLENDGIQKLPRNIRKLSQLEQLYLANNQLRDIPIEIKGLKKLKYLELNQNNIPINVPVNQVSGPGLKIKF